MEIKIIITSNIQNSKLDLAPIVLFVYNRPRHLRQTVEALQKNDLANESELFIFSDGAKPGAEIPNYRSSCHAI